VQIRVRAEHLRGHGGGDEACNLGGARSVRVGLVRAERVIGCQPLGPICMYQALVIDVRSMYPTFCAFDTACMSAE